MKKHNIIANISFTIFSFLTMVICSVVIAQFNSGNVLAVSYTANNAVIFLLAFSVIALVGNMVWGFYNYKNK